MSRGHLSSLVSLGTRFLPIKDNHGTHPHLAVVRVPWGHFRQSRAQRLASRLPRLELLLCSLSPFHSHVPSTAQSEAAAPEGTAITPLLESKDHRLASHQACLDSQCHMGAPSSALLTLRTRQDEDAMTVDCVTRGPSSFNTITLSNKQNLYCALSTVFREPKKV